MAAPWDAPLGVRNQYAEEGDPAPPAFTKVPHYRMPANYDPHELLGVRHAYAGQLAVLNLCAAALDEQLRRSGLAEHTQLMLLSARGFPLGEHGRVGACDEALYNETVQMAWLMRFPDGWGKMAR